MFPCGTSIVLEQFGIHNLQNMQYISKIKKFKASHVNCDVIIPHRHGAVARPSLEPV